MQQEDDISSKLRVWFADVETGKARPLFQSPDICLNAVFDKYALVVSSVIFNHQYMFFHLAMLTLLTSLF